MCGYIVRNRRRLKICVRQNSDFGDGLRNRNHLGTVGNKTRKPDSKFIIVSDENKTR